MNVQHSQFIKFEIPKPAGLKGSASAPLSLATHLHASFLLEPSEHGSLCLDISRSLPARRPVPSPPYMSTYLFLPDEFRVIPFTPEQFSIQWGKSVTPCFCCVTDHNDNLIFVFLLDFPLGKDFIMSGIIFLEHKIAQ